MCKKSSHKILTSLNQKLKLFLIILVLLLCKEVMSQVPSCPSNLVYILSGSTIYNYDPYSPVIAGTNPSINSISLPAGANGLAVSNNLNGTTPSPTFYTTLGNNYYYYNGSGWVNTGHSTGNPAAVNIGGSGNFIYNLTISSSVYIYDGTSNGTLLTNVNFSPGGALDVIGDDCGNFYVMKTSFPQVMSVYNPSGTLVTTYTMTGMPSVSNGGGFAITGNKIFVANTSGFFTGTITGNSINFTSSQDPLPGVTIHDFGSCAFPPVTITAATTGSITCSALTATVAITTSLSPVTYSWSGPGIVGSTTSSSAVVNAIGQYTCIVTPPSGCSSVLTTNVYPGVGAVIPSIAVSNSLTCASPTAQLSVSVTPSSPSYTYAWTGPGITSGSNTQIITVNAIGLYSVTATNSVTGCSGSNTVNVVPGVGTLTLAATNTVMCSGSNGVSLTVNSNGATSYTWSPSSSLSSATGSVVVATPSVNTSYTITGSDGGTCTASTVVTVTVATTPMVSVNPNNASICIGASGATFTASGANTYSWSPAATLSSSSGSVVTANPTSQTIYTVVGTTSSCTNAATFTVNISPSPTIAVSPLSSSICAGSTVALTANGNATSYTWSPSSSLSSPTGPAVIASPSITTSYTITGTNGLCNSAVLANVSVTAIPNITVSPTNATICINSAGKTFTASGATNYTWSPGTGLSSTSGAVVNVNPTSQTIYTVVGSVNTCTNSATFTVDITPSLPIGVNPNNSYICSGNSVNITASGATTYTWSNATGLNTIFGSSVTASPSITTTYNILGSDGSCTGTTSFTVNVIPTPSLVLSSNITTFCEGDSASLSVNGASSYVWAPSSSLSSATASMVTATPSTTTVYFVTGTNGTGPLCTDTKSITINVIPKIFGIISPDVEICYTSAVMIQASGGNTIKWIPTTGLSNSNSPAPVASPSTTTTYTAIISDNGQCADSQSVIVYVNPLPLADAGRDTTITHGDSLRLQGTGTGQLAWISGDYLTCNLCANPCIFPENNSCYVLQALDIKGCRNTDVMCVKVNKEFGFYIPNSFTPNNDGLNDLFLVSGYGIKEIELQIFDRWGVEIFKTKDVTSGWDGKSKGILCKNDVYVYRVILKTISGETEIKVGHVTLLGK